MKELSVRDILVPIDFSDISVRAIPVAKNLGRKFGSKIHLAFIQEPYYPAMFYSAAAPAPAVLIDAIEEERKRAHKRLQGLAKSHRLSGTVRSVLGAPVFDEVCAIARRVPADLIVTSTHGYTGLQHLLLGSTAERIVQHAPCPVFVARERKGRRARNKQGRKTETIETILAPHDFSACSVEGLKYAVRFARKFGAKLVVLHVVDVTPTLGADGLGVFELTRYTEVAQAEAERKMPMFLRWMKSTGVKFESKVVQGRSADAICVAAKKHHADLIITATHGRTGLSHVLVGSTAEVVVRYAPCPVLVVPSHPVARKKRLQSKTTRPNSPRSRRKPTKR